MQLKQYAVDQKAAEEGRVFELGEGSGIKLARLNNRRYTQFLRDKMRPFGGRVDRIPDEQKEAMMDEALAKTVVLDWWGIMDGDTEVPYSVENVMSVFRRYPDFRTDIMNMAGNLEAFRAEDMAEDMGNSVSGSEQN